VPRRAGLPAFLAPNPEVSHGGPERRVCRLPRAGWAAPAAPRWCGDYFAITGGKCFTHSMNLARALLTFLLLNMASGTSAQSTWDALSLSEPISGAFLNVRGVGWTFTPKTDIRATSVGYWGPFDPSPLTLQFWDGTNEVISSYAVSYSTGFQYQSISPLSLNAGHRYGISLTDQSQSAAFVTYARVGSPPCPECSPIGTFDVSPYLTEFRNYIISDSTGWIPYPPSPGDMYELYLGATFQFQVVAWLRIAPKLFGQLEVSWPTDAVGYHLEYAEHLPATSWLLVTNAVQTNQSNYVVVDSISGNRFYRLHRP